MNSIRSISFGLVITLLLAGCASTPPVKSASEYFKDGEEAFSSKNYEDAIGYWKKVKESYFNPELTTMAELKIADAQYANKSFIEAAASYEEFRKLHPKHEKAPYALFRMAMCQFQQITGIDTDQTPVSNAVSLFTQFLKTYPTSEYAKEAKEKLDEAVATQVRHEIYVGRFYLRTEKYQAAIKRLEGALARFPSSSVQDETLLYLGEAYISAGDKPKGRETLDRLSREYPASPYLDDARKFMEKHY